MHFVAHFIEHFVRSLCRSLSKSPDKVLDKVCDKDGFGRLHILLLIMVFLPLTALAQAQPSSEDAAFAAAARSLTQLGAYKQARKEFREFREKYPQSVKIPEAVLFEAMAAVKLNDHEQAASLLASNLAKAGVYTEEYHYWLGEANLQGSNYLAAAESFARLAKNFPQSQRILDASYGEALARFRLKEWPRVSDLLQAPAGTFQKIAAARPNDELVIRGQLLLADALLEQKQPAAAESVLNNLNIGAAPAEVKWQWQNLLCRIELAENKPQSALAGSSNLVTLADAAAAPNLRAESVALQAGMLQQLNRLADAAAAYEQNLRKEIPAERRREALLKIIDLTLAQDALDAAAAKLERLLADHASDAGSDVARITLGELRIKQYFAASNNLATATNSAVTNTLQAALAQFDELLKSSPQSPLAGKAHLDRGWCLWESGKIAESGAAFQAAASQLAHSQDQAIARFKVGDALLFSGDYSNALENFRAVLHDYSDVPAVKESLVPQALYHSLRCHIELNQLADASAAMRQILDSSLPFADKSVLLIGQRLSAAGEPVAARRLFSDFSKRFPSSELLPEVELALARTHAREKNWEAAIRQYDRWLDRYPTNDLRPEAEFNRGWACFQAGQETNALVVFTNFLAAYPTQELARAALRWIGDFYYRQNDFDNAERHYQLLFQSTNWPVSAVSWEARMLAGRAAVARQNYKNAAEYFRSLLNDNNCPTNLLAEAWFALGDTMLLQDPDPGKTRSQKYTEAVAAFKKIPDQHPDSPLVSRAWGAIGNCYLQMAASDPKYYDNAKEAYLKIINDADITTRSQAEIGLGAVLEKQARLGTTTDSEPLLDSAFEHYLNVLSGKTSGDEQADIIWIKKAGLEAARLAEERKQWEMAINIYNNLSSLVPSAAKGFQRKIERAREQWRGEKN